MNSCIAERAYPASRFACEKSFTVAMFVYASVTRPVINERASACAAATFPSRGTKNTSAAAYNVSQPRNGSSSHASKLPTTATIVTK
jgi:hypothetical protein